MRVGLALMAGWLVLSPAAFALDVTRCGQTIGRGQTGELGRDLDCPAYPGTCASEPALSCTADAECPNVSVARCGLDGSNLPPYPAHQAVFRAALGALRMRLDGLIATDNGGAAALGGSVRIVGGTLGDNAADSGGWDILSLRRPRLTEVTCSRSGQVSNEGILSVVAPWFVCAGD
jgi:hypothetical protein